MYILWISLFVILLVGYQLNGKNIFSVFEVSVFMSFITITVFIISKDYFQYYEIDYRTTVTILTALITIGVGEYIAYSYTIKRHRETVRNNDSDTFSTHPIILQQMPFLVICFFMASVFLIYYREMYHFSLRCGNPGSLLLASKYVREAALSKEKIGFEKGTILTQSVLLSEMLSYTFAYLYYHNKYLFGVKKASYFIPVFLYALQTICSTGRTDIIRLITVIVVMGLVFLKREVNWGNLNDKKILVVGVASIILFLFIFRLLGYLTEASMRYDLWENLSRYISASVIGTDKFVRGEITTNNVVFAQDLFKQLYTLLRSFGIRIPNYASFQTAYPLVKGTSNAYFNIKTMIDDFGMVGMYVCELVVGLFYTGVIKKVKAGDYSMPRMIWLGIMFFPIAMTAISNTYSSLLSISTLYKFIYIYLLNWGVVQNGFRICVDMSEMRCYKTLRR